MSDTERPSEIPRVGLSPADEEMRRLYGPIGCLLSGPGRGDCAHFVGLPAELNRETTDHYGRPIGWCMPCWNEHQMGLMDQQIAALTRRAETAERERDGALLLLNEWRDVVGPNDITVGSMLWYVRQARATYDGTRVSEVMDIAHRSTIVELLQRATRLLNDEYSDRARELGAAVEGMAEALADFAEYASVGGNSAQEALARYRAARAPADGVGEGE